MVSVSQYTYRIVLDGNDGKRNGEVNPANPCRVGDVDPKNPVLPKGGIKQIAGIAIAGRTAKQAINFAASRVEVYTGSAQRQAEVNDLMTGGQDLAMMAINPVAGIANKAFQLITKAIDNQQDRAREQVALQELQRRSGVLYNSSRK